jgi:hypothetical protein
MEDAVVHSELWRRLVDGVSRRRGEKESSSSSVEQKLTLCFRTRDMGVDKEWTMVDVESD